MGLIIVFLFVVIVIDFEAFNKRIFCSHGHIYNKENYPEVDFDILIGGHTHKGMILKQDGKIFLNPGSVSYPRGESVNSFMILDDKGKYPLEAADVVLTLLSEEKALQEVTNKNSAFLQMLWRAKMARAKIGKNAFKHILLLNDLFDEKKVFTKDPFSKVSKDFFISIFFLFLLFDL